ncbi:TPA: hypothetical protein ACGWER_001745 [Streptococcus agalactiae]|nr:hypothetical protein [Streptococcus agalactiae]HEO2267393.1 hypothetical protein [Streptococcus agalactiae]HEO7770319.1 hypothetical protein [Streptococcus agalactiae]
MPEDNKKSPLLISGKEYEEERRNDKGVLDRKRKKRKRQKIYIASASGILLLFIIFSLFSTYQKKQDAIRLEQQREAQIQKQRDEAVKKQEASSFAISKKEYNHNIKVIAGANMGIELDKDGKLTGIITMADGSKKRLIDYTRKDGAFHCVDENNKPIVYNKKWVANLVSKIELTTTSTTTSSSSKSSSSTTATKETTKTSSSASGVKQ